MNVGSEMLVLDSTAELFAGRVINDQENVSGSPWGSVEPEPLSVTVVPWMTVWLGPALAVGACTVFVVMVTVEGWLLDLPSFTINCATYMPCTSAVKVGFTRFGLLSAALLPGACVVFKVH